LTRLIHIGLTCRFKMTWQVDVSSSSSILQTRFSTLQWQPLPAWSVVNSMSRTRFMLSITIYLVCYVSEVSAELLWLSFAQPDRQPYKVGFPWLLSLWTPNMQPHGLLAIFHYTNAPMTLQFMSLVMVIILRQHRSPQNTSVSHPATWHPELLTCHKFRTIPSPCYKSKGPDTRKFTSPAKWLHNKQIW
jgi:hypothetical protein